MRYIKLSSMKYILAVLFAFFSVYAFGQGSPTGAKTQFKNGVAIGSKDTGSFAAADSLFLTIDRNNRLWWRNNGLNGTWNRVASSSATDFIRNQIGSNLSAQSAKFRIDDTAWARMFRGAKAYVDSLQSTSSAGGRIVSNGGTIAAEWGAGSGSNFDFYGFAGYNANRSSSYTSRSFTDKGYVDSSLTARIVWGGITGSLNNQTDLRDTLANRVFKQNGTNLFRQDGKFWVSDTIRTSGVVRADSHVRTDSIAGSVSDNSVRFSGGLYVPNNTGGLVTRLNTSAPGTPFTMLRTSNLDSLILGQPSLVSTLIQSATPVKFRSGSNRVELPNASGTIALTSNVTDSASALRASINTKLNISDTAAMLANRLKISDTANMLSPFMQYSDSGVYIRNQIASNLVRQTAKLRISDTLRTDGRIYGGSNITLNNGGIEIGSNGVSTSLFSGTLPVSLSGTWNSGFGVNAGAGTTSGVRNTMIGFGSLFSNSTGSDNVALGYNAGAFLSGGSSAGSANRSIYIGSNTYTASSSQTNEIVIGDTTAGYGSNTMTLGNTNISTTRIRGNTIIGGTITAGGATLTGALSGTSATFSAGAGIPLTINVNTGGNTNIEFRENNTTKYFLRSVTGSGGFDLYDNTLGASVMRWSSTGNVGIGTTSPSYKLDVTGSIRATDSIVGVNQRLTGTLTSGAISATGVSTFNRGTLVFQINPSFAGGNVYSQLQSTGELALATNGDNNRLYIDNSGNITALGVYNATVGGTNRDVFVDNTGLIGYVSSFRASKKNIQPLGATNWLHQLNPVKFNYRIKDSTGKYTDSAYKELEYGLIAEEVEPINKEMVFYDVDSTGKHLRGVHYSKLIIPLLKEIQDQKKTITDLESRVAKLEEIIKLIKP